MTARQLIKALQDLGEDNLDRDIVMFDGPSWYTPYKVQILDEEWSKRLVGKVMID